MDCSFLEAVYVPGQDVIVTSEPGSGKTGAFIFPIMMYIQRKDRLHYALVLEPTRELAVQVTDQFKRLGHYLGLKVVSLTGGDSLERQAQVLNKLRPHVIVGGVWMNAATFELNTSHLTPMCVATPGRLLHHLTETKNFSMEFLKLLLAVSQVLDEADRILKNSQSKDKLEKILNLLPKERQTLLFSATMPEGLKGMEKLSLRDPVDIRADRLLSPRLEHFFVYGQVVHREYYLAALLEGHFFTQRVLVFCNTWYDTVRLHNLLGTLGFKPLMLHSKMTQAERNKNLNQFKKISHSHLVATDVASRGMDLPEVAAVINFDLPKKEEEYTHRVGRTARAGKTGTAISFVTKENKGYFLHMEKSTLKDQQMKPFKLIMSAKDALKVYKDKVDQAKDLANFVSGTPSHLSPKYEPIGLKYHKILWSQ
ncbi:DDX47 [Cordylochernes scorpioides]|uniref:DDX47 n=1 Tax=Cordylochernes scorpioides TaxID=51811 RepID=A0ABY6L5Y2_9ARAC|nr:DDX47 [Cordylochernes scorpioides]